MSNFSAISTKYETDSIVQKSASEILFDLLAIKLHDDVLDLGCGPGHISKLIRDKTSGNVVAIDQARGMIAQAKEIYSTTNISFLLCPAEELNFEEEFDEIFCNSVFQWFSSPNIVLKACYKSLKNNGMMAIQAPATNGYCPNFIKAIDEVKKHPDTKETFSNFTSPWFFLNTSEEYKELFENAGFTVEKSTIKVIVTSHTVEDAYKIFESGAVAGYLNEKYYDRPIIENYRDSFNKIVRSSFEKQANEKGYVDLIFHRIYLLAKKILI